MSLQKVFLDVECYPNYFLICFKTEKRTRFYELYDGNPLDIKSISDIMKGYLTIGFNSNHYDLPMIACAVKGASNRQLKVFSDLLVNSEKPKYQILRDCNIEVPDWDHIDIMEPIPGIKTGLKMYGARIHTKTLQDLPLHHAIVLDVSTFPEIQKYCVNDVDITMQLYDKIKDRIDIREEINKQYDVDVRSKSDPQISETVFKKLLKIGYRKNEIKSDEVIKYTPPSFLKFKTNEAKELFNRIQNIEFRCEEDGKLAKDIFKGIEVTIKDIKITFGIGGIHSNEKHINVVAAADEFIIDVDVGSYYPSIILNNGYYPNLVGADWLNLYRFFYDERLRAKANGDEVKSETYKIILNGCFGKFGSPYSCFYAPSKMLHTTLTGQLSLVMLVEAMTLNGFDVISANTDGITIKGKKQMMGKLGKIIEQWQQLSGFKLDRVFYKAIYMECVNAYFAITTEGKIKRKGIYGKDGLTKNPVAQICSEAVIEYITTGMDIEEYIIRNQNDITKFLITRKVNHGANYKGKYLGKVIRWYYAKEGDLITYKKLINKKCKKTGEISEVETDNKVALSEGAVPLMTLPDKPVTDIDVDKYIAKAFKMLKNLGVKVCKQ